MREILDEQFARKLIPAVSHRDLETRLVALHRERRLADGLRDKYREHLAWDAKQVDEIRADKRSEVQAKLSRT